MRAEPCPSGTAGAAGVAAEPPYFATLAMHSMLYLAICSGITLQTASFSFSNGALMRSSCRRTNREQCEGPLPLGQQGQRRPPTWMLRLSFFRRLRRASLLQGTKASMCE